MGPLFLTPSLAPTAFANELRVRSSIVYRTPDQLCVEPGLSTVTSVFLNVGVPDFASAADEIDEKAAALEERWG